MPQVLRRTRGVVFLAIVLAAALTMTVEAQAAPPGSSFESQLVAASRPAAAARRRRAAPPGGVYSRNAVVVDPANGDVLFEKDANRQVPIASITKLMTVIVFLEQDPDLSRSVVVTRGELYGGGRTQLRNRESVTLGDLLHMALMCSDNVATRVMVRESGLELKAFLAQMNERAKAMGMTRSHFVEVTGLDPGNVSTASDVARLLKRATEIERIHSISTKVSHDFRTRLRWHTIPNTNRLLHSAYEVKSGKTGYLSSAGYCLATWIRTEGRDMIAVVLGAPTAATRFADVKRMVRRSLKEDVSISG